MNIPEILTISVANLITIAAVTYQIDKYTTDNFFDLKQQVNDLNRQVKALKESERR